jgi:hypothetical protein
MKKTILTVMLVLVALTWRRSFTRSTRITTGITSSPGGNENESPLILVVTRGSGPSKDRGRFCFVVQGEGRRSTCAACLGILRPTQTAKNDRPRHQSHLRRAASRNQEAVMKKKILTVMMVLMALTALAAVAAPTVHNSDGTTSNYWVHYYHAYGYHTYYTPVYYYRPVVVAPVVYPVYTYHYWYYKFAGR